MTSKGSDKEKKKRRYGYLHLYITINGWNFIKLKIKKVKSNKHYDYVTL